MIAPKKNMVNYILTNGYADQGKGHKKNHRQIVNQALIIPNKINL
jgi:hypothetical protein